MVVVGLAGLHGCGKGVIAEELVIQHGFQRLYIASDKTAADPLASPMSKLALPDTDTPAALHFDNVAAALDHVTNHWKQHFVTTSLTEEAHFCEFMRRPFFMIVSVLAPTAARLERCRVRRPGLSLEELVASDDEIMYRRGLVHVAAKARLTISNGGSLGRLWALVQQLRPDERWVRPAWDAYFMEMADLASRRSNCMKRCVGAVIVKDKRVIATGYNGTARGLPNCCDGGCPRCNANMPCGVGLEHCYCLHAETNALLEAGRARCEGATMYCTTAPCLGCSQKLIQCGIVRVVYARDYSIEHNAQHMYRTVGVTLVKFVPDLPHYLDAEGGGE